MISSSTQIGNSEYGYESDYRGASADRHTPPPAWPNDEGLRPAAPGTCSLGSAGLRLSDVIRWAAAGAAICCYNEAGTGLAWDKDGMTPHAAIVEKGLNRWKTPDANPRLN